MDLRGLPSKTEMNQYQGPAQVCGSFKSEANMFDTSLGTFSGQPSFHDRIGNLGLLWPSPSCAALQICWHLFDADRVDEALTRHGSCEIPPQIYRIYTGYTSCRWVRSVSSFSTHIKTHTHTHMIFIDFRHNTGDKLIKMKITYSWEIR